MSGAIYHVRSADGIIVSLLNYFRRKMTTAPNYQMKRVIGSGVFGIVALNVGYVFEAENRLTKKRYALKRIEKVSNQLSREF